VRRWPLLVLGLGIGRHYIWPLFPEALQTSAWQIGAALTAAVLVALATMIAVAWLNAPVRSSIAVGLWWLAEELVTVGCEIAYVLHPLSPTGDERCTAQTGVKIGTFGLLAVALLLAGVTRPASLDSGVKHGDRDNG
jgi:type IV secretory pathway VirB3-like protein